MCCYTTNSLVKAGLKMVEMYLSSTLSIFLQFHHFFRKLENVLWLG
jgi:hypothetical protein